MIIFLLWIIFIYIAIVSVLSKKINTLIYIVISIALLYITYIYEQLE
jgi:hypothetical protein